MRPVIQCLKEQNADFEAQDKDGNSAIHLLVQNTRTEDLKSLELAVEILSSSMTLSMLNSRVGRIRFFYKL